MDAVISIAVHPYNSQSTNSCYTVRCILALHVYMCTMCTYMYWCDPGFVVRIVIQ